MNKKTTYEMTIADKLQQLPLPDMEDAIWARIQTQLDLDLPEGDGGGGNTPQAPSGGWIWSAGLLIFVAAFFTVYLLTKKSDTTIPNQTIQPSGNSVITSLNTTATPPSQGSSNRRNAPLSGPQESSSAAAPFDEKEDSLLSPQLILQPLPDTQANIATVQTLPPLQQDSVLKPKPKTRGVKDISDADYRIVPAKKDSTR